jgi:hypothetical protein
MTDYCQGPGRLRPFTLEALEKSTIGWNGHSERSDESRISQRLRSFTSFRMTNKMLLQGLTFSKIDA